MRDILEGDLHITYVFIRIIEVFILLILFFVIIVIVIIVFYLIINVILASAGIRIGLIHVSTVRGAYTHTHT